MKKVKRWSALIIPPLAASIVLMTIMGSHIIIDSDPLWAVKVGQWVLYHGFPHFDPFSWTAYMQPWASHEWGWDVWLYLMFSRLGWYGAVLAVWIPTGILCVIFWNICARLSPVLGKVVFAVSLFGILPWLQARPQVASYMFFVLVLYFLLFKTDERRWLWFVMPGIFLLWANMHGSVPLGIGVISLAGTVRYATEKSRSLLFQLPLLFGATLVNPYGFGLWRWSVWTAMHGPLWSRYIAEWKGLDFGSLFGIVYGGLLIIGLVIIARFCRPKTWQDIFLGILVGGSFLAACIHVRFIPYAFMAVGTLVCMVFKDIVISNRVSDRIKSALFGAIAGAFVVGLVLLPPVNVNMDRYFPAGGVSYIQRHNLKRVFNFYNWGGYMIYMGVPPFIDGRAGHYVMDGNVFNDYVNAIDGNVNAEKVMNKWNINAVFIPNNNALKYVLLNSNKWLLGYKGKLSIILVRRT